MLSTNNGGQCNASIHYNLSLEFVRFFDEIEQQFRQCKSFCVGRMLRNRHDNNRNQFLRERCYKGKIEIESKTITGYVINKIIIINQNKNKIIKMDYLALA